jgi:hypothetical protein
MITANGTDNISSHGIVTAIPSHTTTSHPFFIGMVLKNVKLNIIDIKLSGTFFQWACPGFPTKINGGKVAPVRIAISVVIANMKS